mgnify:FL=1
MKIDKETVINEMLVNNYEKYYRIAYSYAKNESDAQDIVQESAYKAIFNSEKIKEIQYADTWICRIIINESIEFLRKNQKEFADVFEESSENNQYENIDLRQAIERLSPKEKSVVVLRYFEDMTLEQVADAAGENLSTVKSRLYRALGKMKIDLSGSNI